MQNKMLWRILQAVVWLAGAAIFVCLIFFPKTGVLLIWNILIPVAPALIALATGVWRNICPIATTVLLPRHLNFSKRKIMPVRLQAQLSLVAVLALYIIVPLRHALFNNSGAATALLLFALVLTGFIVGFFYEWKSSWCSSLCPVHPVEKLYGANVIGTVPNAHCTSCMNCVVPCPDSTPNINPLLVQKNFYHKAGGALITGGLPGFVWGWFQVPDATWQPGLQGIADIYGYPVFGMLITLFLFLMLSWLLPGGKNLLAAIFGTAAISCYYWFRLPGLFGYGIYPGDGLLVDISKAVPAVYIYILKVALVIFFTWWLVIRKKNHQSWLSRPASRPSLA